MLLTSGGADALLDFGGQDATAAFEDVGHSPQAREYLDGLLIGELEKQVWRSHSSLSSTELPSNMHLTTVQQLHIKDGRSNVSDIQVKPGIIYGDFH
jgi:cytochrome b involved in lipid metabolism